MEEKKVVTLGALREASAHIATKAELAALKQQLEENAVGSMLYASTEEVLALFQDAAQKSPTE